MDPQQRILLELAWSALENAGHSPGRFPGLVGVFAGVNWNRYRAHCVAAHPEVVERFGEFPTALANELDFLATRISYKLNLRGPSITVGTACSTSLVAIAQAAQSLLNFECDMALAGGASITVPVKAGYLHQEDSMLSVDGHCRAFDAKGTGTTFSDGAALVVLRRLEDALRDGDRVIAVIRGYALNNDGSDKVSFTAPSVDGQERVIRSALELSDVEPASIGFIEAHGTATPLGDPIEVAALQRVFTRDGMKGGQCALGSVKSAVGHLVHAAGVAGFLKAALAVHSGKIPPTLFFETPNPRLQLETGPFFVNNHLIDWPARQGPRRAGVSSFGVGGTNAHVILEEPPVVVRQTSLTDGQDPTQPKTGHLLVLSAKTESALKQVAKNLADHLETETSSSLEEISNTLWVGRDRFSHRLAVSGFNRADLVEALRQPGHARVVQSIAPAAVPPLVWVFPGQGSQYAGMGRDLYRADSDFRWAFDEALAAVSPFLSFDLRERVFGSDPEVLRQTATTQPAVFCLEYALARALLAQGIQPTAMVGHSVGEFVAAVLAGVMSLSDGARIVARRGALLEQLPPGGMLSVRLDATELAKRLPTGVEIAAINGPTACVVSGPSADLDSFAAALEPQGIVAKPLFTSHAFHSAMMEPAIQPLRQEVAKANLRGPTLPIVSTLTGQWLKNEEATDPDYWSRHLRGTVRFSPAIVTALERHPQAVFFEIGPRASMSTLVRQHRNSQGGTPVAIPTMGDQPETEPVQWLLGLGRLWCQGFEPQTSRSRGDFPLRRVELPTYPFERKRYWLDVWESPKPTVVSAASVSTEVPQQSPATPEPTSSQGDLRAKIRQVFEELGGHDLSGVADQVRFVELGFDSLTLTQAAQQLKRAFGVNIKFRQLMEDLASFDALARFLENQQGGSPKESVASSKTEKPLVAAPTRSEGSGEGGGRVGYDVKKAFGAIARIHTKSTDITDWQRAKLDAFQKRYVEKTKRSKAYTETNRSHTADPRVVNGFRPLTKEITYQIVVESSQGSHLRDIDGNEYVDVLNGFGMNLFGWNPSFINQALHEQLDRGYEIGPQHVLTGEVSRLLCELTGFDRVGLCNTGSEAVMAAMRIARTVTGRDTIALFTGSYHGTFDEVVVRAGRGGKGMPAAPGIMPGMFGNVRVLDYGTPESLDYLKANAEDLAAVLIEPVQSRRPDFQPLDFLRGVRDLTTQHGSCLIFDEVITGFRSHLGGVQALFGIRADLATYGKVIGGGLPIGAVAGKREFMDALDGGAWRFGDESVPTVGVTYFAGTFVRHPLALAASHAALTHLKASGTELQSRLNQTTTAMVALMNDHCKQTGAPLEVVHFASLWRIKWLEDHPLQDLLFAMMRHRGIHILDNFPCFLTTAHTAADLEKVVAAFKDSLGEMQDAGFLPRKTKSAGSFDASRPPVPGARLGRDAEGNPAWFVPNPQVPGKYLKVNVP